ncbi:MAG: sugar transferase [Chloroflexi bacterium]|nr:MAG: sugar transferase [Chloroflexota bacterium]MBL1193681.1 sugar transferase [Chloroflexota bacterium]NOH10973.1 sugar transferase [Chloroflexota bacterium]
MASVFNTTKWSQIFLGEELRTGYDHPRAKGNDIFERLLDYTLVIISLPFVLPILALIAIIIKLDSRGPVLFFQERAGKNGKNFKMFKFRTMVADADEDLHKQQVAAYASGELDAGNGYKIEKDPRVTRVGSLLRNTSLDELPQLFNILRGEMSLVGPRPVPVYEAEAYDWWQAERLMVLPGITGMWQVSGRSEVTFEDQSRLDIRYVRHHTVWLNIKLLLLTFPAVLSGKGAS